MLWLQPDPDRLGFRLDHVPSGPGHGPADHREDDVHPERQERDGDRLKNATQIEAELEARRGVSQAVARKQLHRDRLDLSDGATFLPVAVANDEADLVDARIRIRVGSRIPTRQTGPITEVPVPRTDRDIALAGGVLDGRRIGAVGVPRERRGRTGGGVLWELTSEEVSRSRRDGEGVGEGEQEQPQSEGEDADPDEELRVLPLEKGHRRARWERGP